MRTHATYRHTLNACLKATVQLSGVLVFGKSFRGNQSSQCQEKDMNGNYENKIMSKKNKKKKKNFHLMLSYTSMNRIVRRETTREQKRETEREG